MKQLRTILLILTLLGCQTVMVDKTEKNIQKFNKFLGQEKAKALDQAVISLDKFLNANYPEQKTQKEKTQAFLIQLSSTFAPDSNWIFDTKANKEILRMLERSGMRREIKLYGYEEYKPRFFIQNLNLEDGQDSITELGELKVEIEEEDLIPIAGQDSADLIAIEKRLKKQEEQMKFRNDSALWFNKLGQFLYGLAKYAPDDTLIQSYVESRQEVGNISVSIIIDAYLSQGMDYNNQFFKRMLVADLYLDLMEWDIKRN